MAPTDGDDDVSFGPFRLSRRTRELTAETGPVPIGGRGFDLLATLVGQAGRLVTKNQLLDMVWPGLAVEENNLHVQMAALRRALGPYHTLIQTIPGRGYRFAGVIEQQGAAPAPLPEPAPPPEPTLPAELARLIGRDTELAELQTLLADHRLVTVTGPGGIGKTRLAVALGHAVLDHYPGGARLIDLAPLADDSLVEGAAVKALGLRLSPGAVAAESIAAALRDRRSLLVFDNCEHLLAGTANLVVALLKRCPDVTVIATSQEPLRIEAETIYRLDPLAIPPRTAHDAAEVASFGAVALFIRRVEAADRRFRLAGDNTEAVAEICRSLDGIPLALEMAAARVPALGIEGLRTRLGERLRLLTTGARTAETRHRTLRDTVAWSCDLLEDSDRAIFRRLGVFAGGFSVDSAAAALAGDGLDEWDIADAIGRLIDKSLVVAEAGDAPRYRQLETLRLFALEQLDSQGEHEEFTARHAAYFARFFDTAYESWEETEDGAWLAATAPEMDNMRAALDWALGAPGRRELAISLAGAAALLWDKLSLLTEGRRYLERAEALITPETPPAITARLLRQIGNLWHSSDRPRALAALESAAGLYRALDDRLNLGSVLALIGLVRGFLGGGTEANAALTEARAILVNSNRRKSLLNVMNNLGVAAAMSGDMAAARDLFEEALHITRRAGARDGEILVLINLAEIEFNLGEIDAAVERTGAAVAYLRTTGQQADLGWALVNLGTYLLIAGRLAEAETAAREALRLVRPVGGFILRVCLQQWALLAASSGRLKDAARLAGFVDAGYEKAGETREPSEQRVYDDLQARLVGGLTPIQLSHLTAEGAAWTEQTAASYAEPL